MAHKSIMRPHVLLQCCVLTPTYAYPNITYSSQLLLTYTLYVEKSRNIWTALSDAAFGVADSKLPIKAMPYDLWLYPNVWAPVLFQPRPSYTRPSCPTRKLQPMSDHPVYSGHSQWLHIYISCKYLQKCTVAESPTLLPLYKKTCTTTIGYIVLNQEV